MQSNEIGDKEKQKLYRKMKKQYNNDYVDSLCADHSRLIKKKLKESAKHGS